MVDSFSASYPTLRSLVVADFAVFDWDQFRKRFTDLSFGIGRTQTVSSIGFDRDQRIHSLWSPTLLMRKDASFPRATIG